jgi:hypothetical protein
MSPCVCQSVYFFEGQQIAVTCGPLQGSRVGVRMAPSCKAVSDAPPPPFPRISPLACPVYFFECPYNTHSTLSVTQSDT